MVLAGLLDVLLNLQIKRTEEQANEERSNVSDVLGKRARKVLRNNFCTILLAHICTISLAL